MRHLQPSPLKPALDVKALVRLAAIQNTLITAHLLSDEIQRLDHFQAELLSLLIFCHGDVFDVAYYAEVVDADLETSATGEISIGKRIQSRWGWQMSKLTISSPRSMRLLQQLAIRRLQPVNNTPPSLVCSSSDTVHSIAPL